ncbi:MAG: hypothetical protein HUK14_02560 [Muribaculaceae bacterium]|nr:hypothetical protein [Muribaculaceae bacterium]
MKKYNKKGKTTLIVIIAFLIVLAVSFMPLEKWTNGRIKDFSLISDILPDSLLPSFSGSGASEVIDPELLKAEEDARNIAATLDAEGNPIYNDTILSDVKPSKLGNKVVIEDYTTGEVGLYHLKKAVAEGRLARITMVGDSYIEGDIFTQDLRQLLQDTLGGAGTGYVNMHSDFPGFRRSVKQGGEGWKAFSAAKKGKQEYISLSEQYFMPSGNALSSYKGVTALRHLDSWTQSRFLFIAPNNTTIMLKTSGDWKEYPVTGSPEVQQLLVEGPTGEFDVRTSDRSLVGLGVWLDGAKGVSVDCMSSRGYSGITLAKVSADLCHQMGKFVNYDLVVLEFGINAMTSTQKNYSVYANRLVEVINHVRACYPKADILLLGIGDRGEKRGGVVKSMATAQYMVSAQRDAARRAHCLFWDTREAMGGEDAIVQWSKEGLANKDYIHLTHKGGEKLAHSLFDALIMMIK